MRDLSFSKAAIVRSAIAFALAAVCVVAVVSCNGPDRQARKERSDTKSAYWPKGQPRWKEVELASLQVPLPQIADAEYINDDSFCMVCHETYVNTFQHNVHRGQSCEECHGPASRHLETRGEPGTILSFKQLSPPEKSELCMKCHEQDQCEPGARWRTSVHAHKGVACTDCHTSHYNVPPGTPPTTLADASRRSAYQLVSAALQEPVDQESLRGSSNNLGAITPTVCYRCHSSKQNLEQIAHPHQMHGQYGFTCATCHDPHGKVRPETRTDLCLQCHQDAPTMAWHSSTHSNYGVACTDCHNPHPDSSVPRTLNISHTNIQRPKRMPMSVDEPNACYKCHPKIYAQNAMPSHHPIKEGKMVCSDCHDGHGQQQGNLKGETVNMVCYKCHAEKQGPFAYEHPPVTENCGICHEPHGTVTNNLLRQPASFLCLRCHTGHRIGPFAGAGFHRSLTDIGPTPGLQAGFYSDCTQCHAQIHGSDLPSPHNPRVLVR